MKKLLIISPHFPPVNAADMHRVRQSLPYYRALGWEPVVVAVRPDRVETPQDPLLTETVPADIRVIHVCALPARITRLFGLGSLALRALPFYFLSVNRLLRRERFDLIFFSTTQFPIIVLGAWWKRRFDISYLIDMQDPWLNTYYDDKPRRERPPKYGFARRLNRWLEPIAMQQAAGLMAVSQAYIDTLRGRYPVLQNRPAQTLPFGAFPADLDIARTAAPWPLDLQPGEKAVVYAGRGGHDMRRALRILFRALRLGLETHPALFQPLRFFFVGTSYATGGNARSTILPVAEAEGVADRVREFPERLPYFQALRLLLDADMLVVPGSDDPQYTASKIYPYILAHKPLLAVFHEASSVVPLLRDTRAGVVVSFNAETEPESAARELLEAWTALLAAGLPAPETDWNAFTPHLAEARTRAQVELFNALVHP